MVGAIVACLFKGKVYLTKHLAMNEKIKKILIVEDEEALLFGLKKLLQSGTMLVDTAQSLPEAHLLITENKYDAIITDLRLSNTALVEGYNVIKLAKEFQKGSMIIVITAYEDGGPNGSAAGLNVDHFLEKPVSPAKIKELLNAS